MKNLQISLSKIICSVALVAFASLSYAQTEKMVRADSLFKAKQYTQSLEIYQSVFNEKKYTPAMLLKMAYINEGLGKIGSTLYFLKLYNLATDDDQALKKSEELATKFKLAGYESNDSSRLANWLSKNMSWFQLALSVLLFIAAVAVYLQRRRQRNPWGAFALLILVVTVLLWSNNAYQSEPVIVSSHKAYLMEGPSSGAAVAGIIDEGNLLKSFGEEDVWVKVKWLDKDVYIKQNAVMKVAL
jgi:hypothetical protein